MSKGLCVVIMGLVMSVLHAQAEPVAVADSFHAEIVALYDFQPGTLPQKEMEAKSGELDAFWEKVKAGKAKLGPALRRELARVDVPGFFLYDGSMLLLELDGKLAHDGKRASNSPVDRKDAALILAALARCPFKGLQTSEYLRKVHWLASEGNDATAAALHVLDEPGFQAFIASHALTLGQDYSLACMLLPTDEALWVKPVIDRLVVEKDEKACAALLLLLWYAATPATDEVIQRAAEDKARPDAVRKVAASLVVKTMFMSMMYQNKDRAKDRVEVARKAGVSPGATVAALKTARRKRMAGGISDEALADLDQFTLLIRSRVP